MNAITIVGMVLGGVATGFFGLLIARLQAKSSPYGDMVTRLSAAEGRLDTVEKKLIEERKHSREQDRALSRFERALNAWETFGRDLHARWPEHRQRETPPALPSTPASSAERRTP